MHRRNLTLSALPVPMREHMQCRFILIPQTSVEVEAVLRDISEVYDSKDGRMVRPCVGVVRGRFADIVEACPYELSYAPRVVLVRSEVLVRNV
jgi:hypothetical protein